jgi:hypothetical protein
VPYCWAKTSWISLDVANWGVADRTADGRAIAAANAVSGGVLTENFYGYGPLRLHLGPFELKFMSVPSGAKVKRRKAR